VWGGGDCALRDLNMTSNTNIQPSLVIHSRFQKPVDDLRVRV
jgi:hypothetical protein